MADSTFPERLLEAMKARGYSQSRLEREAGFTAGHLSRLVNGKGTAVEPETLARLNDCLKVNFEWLAIGRGHMDDVGQKLPPRFRDHPDWAKTEKRVRAGRHGRRFSEEAYQLGGDAMGGKMPAHIDEVFMIQHLEVWQRIVDDPDGTGAAEDAEIEKVHASDRARHRLPVVANESDEPAGEHAGKTGRTKKGLAAGAEQEASPLAPPTTDKPKSGTRPKRRP